MSVTLEEIQNEKKPHSLRFLQSLVFYLASEKEADKERPPQASLCNLKGIPLQCSAL